MSQSELERLTAALHALSDQVLRDTPHLAERRRHIAQLAARSSRLARQSNDRGLARVADLARVAAEKLDDALTQIADAAGQGNAYADHLTGSRPSATAGDAQGGQGASVPPAPSPGDNAGNLGDGPETAEDVGRRRRSGRPRSRAGWADVGSHHRRPQHRRRRRKYKTTRWSAVEERLLKHGAVVVGTVMTSIKAGPNVWTFAGATITHAIVERLEWKSRRGEDK